MSTLDSFLNTVFSEITIDQAKRSKIEQALRACLEAAVARATEKGLDRETAEREVVVAFGGSTWLARRMTTAPRSASAMASPYVHRTAPCVSMIKSMVFSCGAANDPPPRQIDHHAVDD